MRGVFRIVLGLGAVMAIAVGSFRLLYPVPTSPDRNDSVLVAPSLETPLGAIVLPLVAEHPGLSGVLWLGNGYDAFAARIASIDLAQDSIDLRTYIWQNDVTGYLMLEAVQRAAERGVRVRLLLDDNGTPNLDRELAELNRHPNVEIRLFNPFVLRSPRLLSFALDFSRVNRRMHNKSMTVDGVVAIAGGRNIGDIYFSASEEVNYFDLDIMVLGQAADDVAQDFDLYWASPSAVPVELFLPTQASDSTVIADAVAHAKTLPNAHSFVQALERSDFIASLKDGTAQIEWVPMQMVSDNPIKGQGLAGQGDLMIHRLADILGEPTKSVTLVSAYFVPGKPFTALLSKWAQSGVTVRTLTNSQEATDVLPVHAGYRLYRDDLLNADVGVYELKSDQDSATLREMFQRFDLIGSSAASLHAKTFVVDRNRLFVGSYNFDPRSTNLNTEMGFLIHSPLMANQLADKFDSMTKSSGYHVTLTDEGDLHWSERRDDGSQVEYTTEPKTTWITRGAVRVIGWLPVMWML